MSDDSRRLRDRRTELTGFDEEDAEYIISPGIKCGSDGPRSQKHLSSSPRSSYDWRHCSAFFDRESITGSLPTDPTSLQSRPPFPRRDGRPESDAPSVDAPSHARSPQKHQPRPPIDSDGEEVIPPATVRPNGDGVIAKSPSVLFGVGSHINGSSARHNASFREKDRNDAENRPSLVAPQVSATPNAETVDHEPETNVFQDSESQSRERRLTLSGVHFPDRTRGRHRKITQVLDAVRTELGSRKDSTNKDLEKTDGDEAEPARHDPPHRPLPPSSEEEH